MLTSPIHKAPTLLACIPLIIGIIINQHYSLPITLLYQLLVVIAFLVITLQFFRTRRRSYINIIHLSLFAVAFFILGYLRYEQVDERNEFEGPLKANFTATVLSTPVGKTKSYRVDLLVDTAYIDSTAYAVDTKVISYIEKSPIVESLLPGQRIQFRSVLNPPPGVMNPEDFDYQDFLQRKGIFATTYIPADQWQLLDSECLTLRIVASRVQHKVVTILDSLGYGDDEMALISALTVGYKQKIGDDQRQAYIASGCTHVLAVSGLHVGIIFLFLTRLFKIFGKSRKVVIMRLVIIISLLWCFAFITGLSPSVTRATLMFSLVSIGTAGRQRSSIFNTVYLSAFILLAINPHLAFDIGFQLSYCAVLGIIAFQPYFAKVLTEKLHLPKFLADLIAVSIAAQLGTVPISIHTFNCFPNYFILTNIWVIPLVGLIVNGAIVLIIVTLVGLPNTWIAVPLGWLLKAMNTGVEFISQLPQSLCTYLYIDTISMLLLYAALIMLVFALDYHSKRYLFIMVLLVIGTLGTHLYHQEKREDTSRLMVFCDRKAFNISAQQGHRSTLLLEPDSTMKIPSYFVHHFMARQTLNTGCLQKQYQYYNLYNEKDFIITQNHIHAIYSSDLSSYADSISISSLIINKEEPYSIYSLYEHVIFNTLVIYQRPEKHVNYYRNFCDKKGIDLYLVYEAGAYICDF